jgi:tRNA dimethylallyltransferase
LKKNKLLIVIAGPTAAGKTGVAIEIAERLQTEIVSADSRQIYREMTIGTAKPSQAELQRVKHHFIDTHNITEDYDAAAYGKDALKTVTHLFETRDHVILCGGSGLYIQAVCKGFDDIPEISPGVRQMLLENYNNSGLDWLQEQMRALDPEYFKSIDQQNPHRLIRALEVRIATGKSITSFQKKTSIVHPFRILKIGLELPRKELYERIDMRVDQMVRAGLFDEAEKLYPFKNKNALQTVGYKEIFDFIDGHYDSAEAVRLLKQNTRRYAKRQLTWFKKDPEMTWFHPREIDRMMALIHSID